MVATELPRRRFITRTDVDDARRAGVSIQLGPRDVLTDEAAGRARSLGVEIVREGGRRASVLPAAGSATGAAASTAPASSGSGTAGAGKVSANSAAPVPVTGPERRDRLREAVRAAVVAELGPDTPGLEQAIEAVFARRYPR